MVVPTTQEAKARDPQVQGQCGLQSKTVSKWIFKRGWSYYSSLYIECLLSISRAQCSDHINTKVFFLLRERVLQKFGPLMSMSSSGSSYKVHRTLYKLLIFPRHIEVIDSQVFTQSNLWIYENKILLLLPDILVTSGVELTR